MSEGLYQALFGCMGWKEWVFAIVMGLLYGGIFISLIYQVFFKDIIDIFNKIDEELKKIINKDKK